MSVNKIMNYLRKNISPKFQFYTTQRCDHRSLNENMFMEIMNLSTLLSKEKFVKFREKNVGHKTCVQLENILIRY